MALTVYDHKTLSTSGPAVLCIPLIMFNYLNIFITQIRAPVMRITKAITNNVFITFTGQALSTSGVGDQMSSFWEKATGKTMNASLMRKSCVSIVHSSLPEFKSDLAAHMNHALRTAENTYFIQDKLKKSAKTSELLRKTLRNKAKEEPEHESEYLENDETIDKIFCESIKNGKITMAEVREAAENHSILRGKERAVYFRVRYLIDSRCHDVPPLPLECDTPSDRINRMLSSNNHQAPRSTEAPSGTLDQPSDDQSVNSLSASTRYSYTKDDNNKIAAVFREYIQSKAAIREDMVYAMFKERKELSHLCEKLSSKQLVDKVRNMRKSRHNKRR